MLSIVIAALLVGQGVSAAEQCADRLCVVRGGEGVAAEALVQVCLEGGGWQIQSVIAGSAEIGSDAGPLWTELYETGECAAALLLDNQALTVFELPYFDTATFVQEVCEVAPSSLSAEEADAVVAATLDLDCADTIRAFELEYSQPEAETERQAPTDCAQAPLGLWWLSLLAWAPARQRRQVR